MGLLEALKQYASDAAGGSLNPEVGNTLSGLLNYGKDRARYIGGLLDDSSPINKDFKNWHDRTQLGLADLIAGKEGPQADYGYSQIMNMAGVAPVGIIGKHHTDTLSRLSKGFPDDVVDNTFGVSGHAYYTPMRPFENSQANSLGVKTTPIAERAFQSDAPLTAKQLADIEAVPLSSDSMRSFAKELSDEGLFAMMHKDGKRFTVVLPSTKGKGFQMTEYDPKGAIGDKQFDAPEDAIQRMIDAGYSKYMDEGMASRLMNKVMIKQ